ncbi:TRAP transporter substrate-binding protein [Acuticoccus mangrovi]|uniref:TRAP transporter substrate-binding protein n=1 Tax=Acuticoccus mangrovi TaxID=2796142 RepID=A0A934IQI8_9HYPH|nr:TRAP transporter substrate-binding protein [Acuticoccus mangrovi]MBJ3776452.1 TRAP transporter substrate-binding protein [Acuticoccus mangrovi]
MTSLRALSLVAITALAGFSAPALGQTTLTVSNWLPPSHPIVKDIVIPWGEAVKEATDGRVTVEVMAAPIGKPPAQYDLIRDGAADIGYGVHGYTPNRFALTTIAELPFLSDSSETLSVAYQKVYDKYLAKANEHEGVKLLAVWTHGPGEIYTVKDPVKDVADLSGKKMRVGGGLANMVADKLGIVPVSAPSPQVYEILSNGVADGILFPPESVPFFKIDTVLKYGTEVPGGLYNTSFFMIMNEDTWNGLSDEDKKAIDGVSGVALAERAGKAWDAADAAGRKTMAEAGMTVTAADEAMVEELHGALAGIEAVFIDAAAAKGVDGVAALKMLHDEAGN